MLALQPRLAEIDDYLDEVPQSEDRWPAYEQAKAKLTGLVGFHADDSHESLRTSEAYDLAIKHITDRLEL